MQLYKAKDSFAVLVGKLREAAYGESDKAAVAHVTDLARDHVRNAVEAGQPAPLRRHFSEMPSYVHAKEIGRAIIPVEVERRAASPVPPYSMSP